MAPGLGRQVEGRTDLSGVRGFLVLAAFLVAVLVAFLVAWPRLVDVPSLRGELVRVLRQAGGSEMRIDGAVRLELLPLPSVAIDSAVIGDRIEVGPRNRFTADRIDIDLAPLALLAGRIEPMAVQLVRPELELVGSPGPLGGALIRSLADGPFAQVRRIDVVDGSLRLAGSDGAVLPTAYHAVDLSAVRDGNRGLRLEGSAAVAGEPLRFELSGEPLAADAPVTVTLRVEAGPRDASAVLDFVGQVTPGPGEPTAAGSLQVSSERGPLPRWLAPAMALRGALEARLTASARRIDLADLVLTSAEGQLRGAAAVDLGEVATFDVTLEGTTLIATTALIDDLRRLMASAKSHPGLSGRATLQFASLTWRDGLLRRLRVEAGVKAGRPELGRLDAVLPGQATLNWVGLEPTADEAMAGELSLQAGELRPLLAWLGVAEADLPPGGLTTLDLTARATIGENGLALRRVRARLDATQVEGSLAYARAPRPRLDLALTADRLNTALYQSPPAWADWRARLEALNGTLDITVDRLSHDILRGQGVRLRATLDGGRLDLPELRVADLAGAGVELSGTVDLPLGAWDLAGMLQSSDPKPIMRLLRVEAPPEIDRLAPLRLEGNSRREAGVTSLALRLTAKGATATFNGQLTGEPADGALEISAMAQSPDTGALLLALGWPAPPSDRPTLGPLSISGEASRAAGPTAIGLDAKAGESSLSVKLALDTAQGRPMLGGIVRAPSLDRTLIAALYETLALPLDFPPGRPWLWPGIWPREPLSWVWLDRLDLHIPVEVGTLRDHGADLGPAAGTVLLSNGSLSLSGLRLPVAGGVLAGAVAVHGKDDFAVLGADLRLTGARAEELAAATAPGSTIRGALDLGMALHGQGRSVADMVASLSGKGDLALREARLTGVEVDAAAQADAAAAPAQIDNANLTGQFTVTEGALVSESPGLAMAYPGGAAAVDLRFDLLAWLLDARFAAPGMTRRYLGPPGRIRPVPPS